MKKKPQIAFRYPSDVFLEAGKTYYWCACGRSRTEPFCDGSHAGTNILPVLYQVSASKTVYLCQCKYTKNPPICDGSHTDLPE